VATAGDTGIDDKLTDLGVTTVAIPRKARPSAARREIERQPAFRRLVDTAPRHQGTHLDPQTRLRDGPHPPRRHRRSRTWVTES
jgi:hypothetical protein